MRAALRCPCKGLVASFPPIKVPEYARAAAATELNPPLRNTALCAFCGDGKGMSTLIHAAIVLVLLQHFWRQGGMCLLASRSVCRSSMLSGEFLLAISIDNVICKTCTLTHLRQFAKRT